MVEHMFDNETYEGIPRGLDTMPPGPALAAFLATLEVAALNGHDRVVVMRAHQRMAAHHHARVLEAMAAVAETMHDMVDDDPKLATEAASAEIRAALCLTRRAADADLELALGLKGRLPQVLELLKAGELDVRRARVLVDGTDHLPEEAARAVVDRVVCEAPRLTSGQLRARLQRLCLDADPGEARLRFDSAVEERRLVMEPTVDGTAHLLGLDLPPDRVASVTERINCLARRLRCRGETRTMDQLRADVFLDLLNGTSRTRGGRRGVVELRIDATTLAGLSETAGELGGYGPVIADIARRVAAGHTDAEWRYAVTDPQTGRVVHTGVTNRRPTAAQRRKVESRYPVCTFPGCRMPAIACDLDHRIPFAHGGPTLSWYLAPCCRHDHVIRHRAGWRYRRLANGDHLWTSPLGHTYTTSGTPP